MAISAPAKSAQYTLFSAGSKVVGYDWGAKILASYCKLTFTAAGTTTASAGDISLIKMPPGKLRIIYDLSWLACPQGTSTADLDIGWNAYTTAGVAVAANEDGFLASLDVGGGAIGQILSTAHTYGEFDSDLGFDIVCSFDTANSPASGDLTLFVPYMRVA